MTVIALLASPWPDGGLAETVSVGVGIAATGPNTFTVICEPFGTGPVGFTE